MAERQRGPAGTWRYLIVYDGADPDLAATAAGMPDDDLDAARLLTTERPGELHYSYGPGIWHVWDGTCHRPDDSGEIGRMTSLLAERMALALEECQRVSQLRVMARLGTDADPQLYRKEIRAAGEPFEAAVKYAAGLRRRAGGIALAGKLSEVCACSASVFEEQHPRLLNCANGTLDLASGQLRRHDPADMMTYCLATPHDPLARAPVFARLLRGICGENMALTEYLMRVLGYCLLGSNPRQLIFFINGPTGTGKSVLMQILGRVLEGLAHESQADLITLVRHGRNARTENSIRGARLVTITETSAFMTIDEGQLKRLTGEAWISVDQHYAKTEIKTPVTWTIVLVTNQMPALTNFDDAMQRRVRVIPGGPTIPEELRDEYMAERILGAELPGILAALTHCARLYLAEGLHEPVEVRIATDAYRQQENTVANFASECCDMVPGGGPLGSLTQSEAYEEYQHWARGGHKLGRNEFYEHLSRVPGVTRQVQARRFEGIAWNQAVRVRRFNLR